MNSQDNQLGIQEVPSTPRFACRNSNVSLQASGLVPSLPPQSSTSASPSNVHVDNSTDQWVPKTPKKDQAMTVYNHFLPEANWILHLANLPTSRRSTEQQRRIAQISFAKNQTKYKYRSIFEEECIFG